MKLPNQAVESIGPVPVATYARVSSDDQRERETIKTQVAVIDHFLLQHPEYRVMRHYREDGVSGSIPLDERPEGRQLVRDAIAGRFQILLVTRPDRLGRDVIDLFQSRALFKRLHIDVIGILEPIGDDLMFGIRAVVAEDEKRRFLARSAEGMTRAAEEGRYTGGIVPLGYRVEGKKAKARLIPSDTPMWGTLSEADVVRRIYHHLAIDRWSCRRIADDFNRLGIPTAYQKDGRAVRKQKTRGVLVCGTCGLHFCATNNKGDLYYRCDGYLAERGPIPGRCPAKAVQGKRIEPSIWQDIERFLRDPGPLLDELVDEATGRDAQEEVAAELANLRTVLTDLGGRRDRVLETIYNGHIDSRELNAKLEEIASQRRPPRRGSRNWKPPMNRTGSRRICWSNCASVWPPASPSSSETRSCACWCDGLPCTRRLTTPARSRSASPPITASLL